MNSFGRHKQLSIGVLSVASNIIELSKWVFGHHTVLAEARRVSLPINTKFELSETGGGLVVWTGWSTLTPILSATDSTYRRGYVGIEANGGEGTAYNFRAGNLTAGG